MWTPYQIEIMLHYHCSVGAFVRWRAPIFDETLGDLVSMGLLAPYDDGIRPSDPYCYTTTERGRALIEMWCATPIPEMKFVDPRFSDTALSQRAGQ